MSRRSRTRGSSRRLTRRTALAGLGTAFVGIGVAASFGTRSVSLVDADRSAGVTHANDTNAFTGLDRSLSVKKNEREPLVYVENTLSEPQTVTVTITNCNNDLLYNPSDDSATCQITGTVGSGQTGRFDIEAQKTGTLNYTIDAESVQLKLNAARSVDVVAGNVQTAVQIKQFSGLTADTQQDEWTLDSVHVKDNDGDDDIDRIELEVQDGNSNTVATETKYCAWNNSGDTVNCKNGAAYNPGGNPDLTIQPDDSTYDVTNQTYQATVTGYDADGNFDTDTVTTNE